MYTMQLQFCSSSKMASRSPHPMILQSQSTDSQLDVKSYTSKKSHKSTKQKIESPTESPPSHRFLQRTNPSSVNDSSESSTSQDLENLVPAKRPKCAREIFRSSPPNAAASSPRSVSDAFQRLLSRSDDDNVWIQRCNAFDEEDEDEVNEVPGFTPSITE
jgi:hypothetical protein